MLIHGCRCSWLCAACMTFICYEVITSSMFPPSLPKKATTTGEHECGTRQHMPAQYDQGHMLDFWPYQKGDPSNRGCRQGYIEFHTRWLCNKFRVFWELQCPGGNSAQIWEQYRTLQGNGDAELAKMGTGWVPPSPSLSLPLPPSPSLSLHLPWGERSLYDMLAISYFIHHIITFSLK